MATSVTKGGFNLDKSAPYPFQIRWNHAGSKVCHRGTVCNQQPPGRSDFMDLVHKSARLIIPAIFANMINSFSDSSILGSGTVPTSTLAKWQNFTANENFCLTWGGTSPSSKNVLNHKGDFWVKIEIAQSGRSLLVLDQILVESENTYNHDFDRTFDEL